MFKFILSDMKEKFRPSVVAHRDGQAYTKLETVSLLKSRHRVIGLTGVLGLQVAFAFLGSLDCRLVRIVDI